MDTIQIAQPVLGDEEWQALKQPILSGWLTQGPLVAEFEKRFADRMRVKHAVATTSCTTALHLALLAMGVKPGDEVIVPSFTWVASANVVLQCGATPVLCDVDPATFNIDPSSLKSKLTNNTRAVIPIHLFGLCADVEKIQEMVGRDIQILGDAACAIGAEASGRTAATLGNAAAFSFHPRKIITTGEGGMLTTESEELAERARELRNHGASIPEEVRHHGPKPYLLPDFRTMGFNYRMTDLQGAVGLAQLKRLDGFLEERKHRAAWYADRLSGLKWLRCPTEPNHGKHGWQAFVVFVDPNTAPLSRNALLEHLHGRGISGRPGTHSVHMLHYYKEKYGYRNEDFPGSTLCSEQSLALPFHNRMSEIEFGRVVEALKELA